jgi:DnaJ-class molecular chaperone
MRKYGHNYRMGRGYKKQYCNCCNGKGKIQEFDSQDQTLKTVECENCNGWGILNPEDLKEVD